MLFRLAAGFIGALCLTAIGAQVAHTAGRQASAQAPHPGAPAAPQGGQAEMRIAAVVNDEVISIFDVVSRMKMIMMSSNISDSPEIREKLGGQVLRSLIDEKLQLQEGKKQGVSASDKELKEGLEQIEKQNNMRAGALNEFLQARGIDRGALVLQMTASIVWGKLVRRQAAQAVDISDEEIDDAMKRAKEHAKEPQSRIAEILLTVDNPAQDEQVRQTAERLAQQMRQGARFSAVARQFSQSATAAVGGDIGWVRPDELPPEIAKAAAQLRTGQLSSPVRVAGGYYLVLVLDRRNGGGGAGAEQDTVYDIVQVVFPLPANPSDSAKRAALDEAANIRSAAKDCATFLKIGKEKAPQLSSEGKLRAANISPQMRNVVDKLQTGQASEPIVQKNGVGVIMVCGKTGGAAGITRDAVVDSLSRQRLDTVARRYLRDLRRAAYVDVRI